MASLVGTAGRFHPSGLEALHRLPDAEPVQILAHLYPGRGQGLEGLGTHEPGQNQLGPGPGDDLGRLEPGPLGQNLGGAIKRC